MSSKGLTVLLICLTALLICQISGAVWQYNRLKKGDAGEPPALRQLPEIDREAALELLEPGECLGGEIEEKQFTIFICKEEK